MTLIFCPGLSLSKLSFVDFLAGTGMISTVDFGLALGVALLEAFGVTGELLCVVARSEMVTFSFCPGFKFCTSI